MSVIPVGERSADPSGVETYDSGDDWEIGVGDLIIDLDADLEKDRQKLEMNRLGSAKGSTKEYEGMGSACASATSAASDGLAFASAQPAVPQGSGGRGKVKRSKTPRDASKSASPSAPYGVPETCAGAGASQDAQGRSAEALATMNPAPGQALGGARAPGEHCARGKEEKSGGRSQSRSVKRERDGGRAKRERQDAAHTGWQLGSVYAPGGKGSPSRGAGDTAKNGVDCGVMDSAGVGKRSDDDTAAAAPAKRPKADKCRPQDLSPIPPPDLRV